MVRLCVVGQCAIELDGVRVTSESEVVFGLILHLAARAGESVSRDELVALFWPDLTHARARHCLRQAVYRLRQLGVPLRVENEAVRLAAADVRADYAPLLEPNAPAAAFAALAAGEILPSYRPAFADGFASWVEGYRDQVTLRIRQGLVRVLGELRSKGRYREAEPLARACLASDPFNEVATLTLAEATAVLSGNRVEAMAILDRYMEEVGSSADERVTLPAAVLRKRIAERFVEQRYAAPPEPPFVGREDVLELLVEKMQEAVTGRSGVVYLWGEPGIGKSRVLDEFTKVALVQGVVVERYNVTPNDPDRPLSLFTALLPRLMARSGALGVSPAAFEALKRFVDPPGVVQSAPPESETAAAVVFNGLKTAIRELIEALAEERPVALLIDDLHWLDNRSAEVLAEVVEYVRRNRVLFLVTSRSTAPSDRRGSALTARAIVRRLAGLAAGEVASLLTQAAEQRGLTLSQERVAGIITSSMGNPLFVSELVTYFAWGPPKDDLPATLQALLSRRVEALGPDALLVFQACAVLGQHVTPEVIGQMLELPTHRLVHALTEVENAGLLRAAANEIVCTHELLRHEALRRLTPYSHRLLCERAAQALSQAAVGQSDAALCWHAFQLWHAAHQASRGVEVVLRVAQRLVACGLAQEADTLLANVRELMPASADQRAVLSLQSKAARSHGDFERALQLAEEGTLLPRTGRYGALLPSIEYLAFDARRLLNATSAQTNEDMVRLASSRERPEDLAALALRIIVAADDAYRPQDALACYSVVQSRRLLQRVSRPTRDAIEIVYHCNVGSLDIAVDASRRLQDDAAVDDYDLPTRVRNLRWSHRPLCMAGLFSEALAALDASLEGARRCKSSPDELAALCCRVEVFRHSGRAAEALGEIERLQLQLRTADAGGRLVKSNALGAKAQLMFALGDYVNAAATLAEFEAEITSQAVARNRVGLSGLRILLCLVNGGRPEPANCDTLRAHWPAMKGMGTCDLPFLALLAVSLLWPDRTSPVALCEDYALHRRERSPMDAMLFERLQDALVPWQVETPPALQLLTLGGTNPSASAPSSA